MTAPTLPPLPEIQRLVQATLAEDIGEGDLTAALIPADQRARAHLITRESAVLCGQPWAEEALRQLGGAVTVEWRCDEGADIQPGQCLAEFFGNARQLLTAERSVLNLLQTLSGTATRSRQLANLVAGSGVRILDTRKTLPGLRRAQKYAVAVGGCDNHRMGLYDAFLIKENHIQACGSITAAVSAARRIAPGRPVEVEVETLSQLDEALDAGADTVMLDNFDLAALRVAVQRTAGRARLEASGGLDDAALVAVAATGVDLISVGALTKHCRAVDLSLRFE